ncbi:hypothetical protein [Bacteriovorax sp. DB6_IX]|uniref:hypothetical protein n=3 Tax=Bacteriovorax sp. DB6_IX TaxID=1353530 RepID=UPI00038A2E4E|nr:hypothetical protein [Bacteriovorax sp. DB6_IX]EQC50408.1 hypothetical protein M901_0142 [Bacteriovorax sp. DB6_IX]
MLTTPVIKDEDLVFPGEGWFLYWKTSASLWKTKLEELSGIGKVIIPINWSFHSDTGDRFDFANEKPETDLKKLFEICRQLDKEVVFLLPITPVPYLPNGGIPFILARNHSKNENGVIKSYVDGDGNINQIYSFFDPRIYTAFTHFCSKLAEYFSLSGIDAGVWAMECGSVQNGEYSSYLEDYSSAFENGFSRFLQAKKEEGAISSGPVDSETELSLKREYQLMIRKLYLDGAENELATYWQGDKRFGFLLGDTKELFHRSVENLSDIEIIDEALTLLGSEIYPSSILLPSRRKKGVFQSFKNKFLSRESVETFFNDKTLSSMSDYYFKQSYTMKIFFNDNSNHKKKYIDESGFTDFCESFFSWDFCYSTYSNFEWEDELDKSHEFFYFSGFDLNMKYLSSALRMFMNGINVIIDKRGMTEDIQRRLESFYLENDLEIEKIRYLTQIETISMGEGRLFIYDSQELIDLDMKEESKSEKKNQFWAKVFNSLDMTYCQIDAESGVRYAWHERNVGPSELKFDKVKRLSVFNPSSYKRKVKIKYPTPLVFQKIIDEQNVEMSNTTHEIELSFMPKGSVSLDFGVIAQ